MKIFALLSLIFVTTVGAGYAAEPYVVSTGAIHGKVSVGSAAAGTQVVSPIRNGVEVEVVAGGVVPVCFVRLDAGLSCGTGLDDPTEATCIAAGDYRVYTVPNERWRGQICAILESGVTAVEVSYNSW